MTRDNDRYAPSPLDRRRFLRLVGATGLAVGLDGLLPAYAREPGGRDATLDRRAPGDPIDLFVAHRDLTVGGRAGRAIMVNGQVPGPLIRLFEGEDVVIRVRNELDESTSIHWHGILLPFEMDGVPGVAYRGIAPGETFTYRFPVRQSGTYWYHSHTGLQEQLGHFGPLVVEPSRPEPFAYDRELVIMLSDWTFENPYKVLAKLKKMGSYYNFQKRTLGDFFHDTSTDGFGATVKDRLAWGRMRMSPTDIADITGYTYTYLVNGLAPGDNWTGLFKPGERVRLRIINAATQSYFNFRIPGLPLTVVAADGQNVEPVTVAEMQLPVAETYDVIVEPGDRAYTIFAESMDRSGFGRGTLAPRAGMSAPVPPLRKRPVRTMVDMGMEMPGMEMGADKAGSKPMQGMARKGKRPAPGMGVWYGPVVGRHGPDDHGPENSSIPTLLRDRLGEPGIGLADVGHRVLVYTDLERLDDDFDERPVDRHIELHLTGNMERYIWGFDGKKFSETDHPIEFHNGERLRLVMVNDTMMEHPIHLHGMWMELENGHGRRIPRKHTVSVKPAERLSVLISVDAPGRWAFHCHLLYHMDAGMFRVVRVS
ncbi:MAG: copper resistance system multicopper oxidase [Acidobacteria bacterium]|nr:copper resistance system multicopper oxidase [Acidobacteriota bacterium]